MAMSLPRLSVGNTALLVVDMQDRLLPAIEGSEACIASVRKIAGAARLLELPVVVTEQYPAGLGRTCAAVREALGEMPVFEKMRFSACIDPVVQRLRELNRPNIIVTGVETHVCVQQSVLDLLGLGYTPFVCADAIGSRRALDREVALDRMRQAGAIVTTIESVIFELTNEAGTERFKQILRIIK